MRKPLKKNRLIQMSGRVPQLAERCSSSTRLKLSTLGSLVLANLLIAGTCLGLSFAVFVFQDLRTTLILAPAFMFLIYLMDQMAIQKTKGFLHYLLRFMATVVFAFLHLFFFDLFLYRQEITTQLNENLEVKFTQIDSSFQNQLFSLRDSIKTLSQKEQLYQAQILDQFNRREDERRGKNPGQIPGQGKLFKLEQSSLEAYHSTLEPIISQLNQDIATIQTEIKKIEREKERLKAELSSQKPGILERSEALYTMLVNSSWLVKLKFLIIFFFFIVLDLSPFAYAQVLQAVDYNELQELELNQSKDRGKLELTLQHELKTILINFENEEQKMRESLLFLRTQQDIHLERSEAELLIREKWYTHILEKETQWESNYPQHYERVLKPAIDKAWSDFKAAA